MFYPGDKVTYIGPDILGLSNGKECLVLDKHLKDDGNIFLIVRNKNLFWIFENEILAAPNTSFYINPIGLIIQLCLLMAVFHWLTTTGVYMYIAVILVCVIWEISIRVAKDVK